MRTLGKLRHEQLTAPARAAARVQEQLKVQQAERSVWKRRAAVFMRIGLVACLVWIGISIWLAMGRTARGIVMGSTYEVTAVADVRVAEVFCRPGQRVRRGDPLLRLEPLHDGERQVLERRLDQSLLRLQLVRNGAGLDRVDPTGRQDRLEEAARELAQAQASLRQLRHEARGLERARDRLRAALRQEDARQKGALEVLQEQIAEAGALAAKASAEREELEGRLSAVNRLAPQGAVAGLDQDTLRSRSQAAEHGIVGYEAAERALRQSLVAAEKEHGIEGDRAEAAVAELDAQVAAAWAAVDVAQADESSWDAIYGRRLEALPVNGVSPAEITALEERLLMAEVAERKAALRAHDLEVGRMIVRAAGDAVVERVHAVAGQLAAKGEPLLTSLDPHRQWVEVYLPMDMVGEVQRGATCTLLPRTGGDRITARVTHVGRVWRPAPALLVGETTGAPEAFLPVRVEADAVASLRPNLEVEVLFTQ